MKFKQVKELASNDLDKKIDEIHKDLMKDYAQMSTGTPPKNAGALREKKKTIAKILTLKRERSGKNV